jgi:uncharacterized OB-fold protein
MTNAGADAPPNRMLPELTDANRAFWTGGFRGELLIQRCDACDRWVHPPRSSCESCGGALEAKPVAGNGEVFTYTVNHHAFNPAVPVPYVIALVTLDEQDDLRLPTNIVDCAPEDVRCGMPVEVVFEIAGDHAVPLFRPRGRS